MAIKCESAKENSAKVMTMMQIPSNNRNSIHASCRRRTERRMLMVAVGLLSMCKTSTSAFAVHPITRSVHFIDSELHAQLVQEQEAAFPRRQAFKEPETKTKASITNLRTSLVKSIVGGGVLALPAAVSALGDNPATVLPVAVALIAAIGVMNAFYFSLIGKVCSWTGAATYTEAWNDLWEPKPVLSFPE